MFKSVLAMKPI